MYLHTIGVNHATAKLELREQIAFSKDELPDALSKLKDHSLLAESVLLSTCNRTEIYVVSPLIEGVQEQLHRYLQDTRKVESSALKDALFYYQQQEAVRHLFQVASGIDSLVVGEAEILGQVKEAYHGAFERGTTGKLLNQLFQKAIHVGKEIRTHTAMSEGQVSIASVAAGFARNIFYDFSGKTLLVVGAGQTGEQTVQAFRDRGVENILVTNRTESRAIDLANQVGGESFPFSDLAVQVDRADIIVSCVMTESPILSSEMIREALVRRKYKPIFIIDLSVPRSVETKINKLNHVYLYDIDDLEQIVQENVEARHAEMEKARPMIDSAVEEFMKALQIVDAGPIIREVRSSVQAMAHTELEATLSRLQDSSEHDREEVQRLVHRLVNKFLHQPSAAVKEEMRNGRTYRVLELFERMFQNQDPDS